MTNEFDPLTIDELIEYKLGLKAKIRELQAEMDRANKVYYTKVSLERIRDAVKAEGLEGIVIVPEPAALTAEGK